MTDYDRKDMWIKTTGQNWKIYIFAALLFLSSIGFFVWIFIENMGSALVLCVVLGAISLLWLSQALKCPKCGYKPAWPIMKSVPASEWFITITRLEHCPGCKNK